MSAPNKSYDPVEVATLKVEYLKEVVADAVAAFARAATGDELKEARIAHAGDRSPLSLANREIGALPPAAKAEAGKRMAAARHEISEALSAAQERVDRADETRVVEEERVDVTLPVHRRPVGARHPLTTLRERIADLFIGMGYEVAEGPELENEWFNFDALNIGADHPARSTADTFYVAPVGSGLVMRTHTSPVQARTMLTQQPPIYVICPGRTYRTDELDATHTPVFGQVEGLVIDRGVTMAHLKGTLDHFATSMFGEGIVTRLRPSFFPFTEPSAEVDLKCFRCKGSNPTCRTCGGQGWIEWGGCGMVNPKVLIACGIDSTEFSGFAFGMGLERTLMFRHGVTDMRDIVEGDVRFTTAFGMEI
ncbi:MAG: phenylalanine--tRNA ligase subunit alpha [Actinobacteria bacterium]|nr:phenylalanine--tRNA ligase subunit alpha [Actinomycetota bacterium]NBP90956.1 phenylalanine--tRNA ligase subunit alpha [Actinomycetota bacterium]